MAMRAKGVAAALAALLLSTAAWAQQCGPSRGTPGQFDYYLLSLSWAPAYCATRSGERNAEQCGPGKRHGLVVHGLWPQYADGTWPQCCQAVPPLTDDPLIRRVSQVMIGHGLRRHEWEKHGSCVSDRPAEYFGKIDRAVTAVGLAPGLEPARRRVKVSDIKTHFPVRPDAITVHCADKGRDLKEIRVCLDRALSPMACPPAQVKADNCRGTVNLLPD